MEGGVKNSLMVAFLASLIFMIGGVDMEEESERIGNIHVGEHATGS
jgi:hypothetical protein